MPLADDIEILWRPVGFAVRINRASEIDVATQRERLLRLLRSVPTLAGQLLDREFDTPITPNRSPDPLSRERFHVGSGHHPRVPGAGRCS